MKRDINKKGCICVCHEIDPIKNCRCLKGSIGKHTHITRDIAKRDPIYTRVYQLICDEPSINIAQIASVIGTSRWYAYHILQRFSAGYAMFAIDGNKK